MVPWTPAQHRLFEAAAHDPSIAARKGIPQQQAAKMASEGIKSSSVPAKSKMLAKAIRGR